MCGIVGYIGKKNAKEVLLEGLYKLEYRGYDSAGISIVTEAKNGDRSIETIKTAGKVSVLEKRLKGRAFGGSVGIAHTRWATHGKPSDKNSHPHSDCSGKVSLVHNGIIENYGELKKELEKKGHRFISETDSEVVAHLIEEFSKKMKFQEALLASLGKIRGTYGLAVLNLDEPEKIYAARMGSPLLLGIGKSENIIASDASAIVRHTSRVIYLDDGEVAVVKAFSHEIITTKNRKIKKRIDTLDWSIEQAQKEGFDHFMLKEIFDQPSAIENALRGRLMVKEGFAKLGGLRDFDERLKKIDRIIITSCGTSYYSALIGEYMLEEYAGIPVEVEYASEFRYRNPVINKNTAVLAISQSGETADTLAAIREAKKKGAIALGIVNVVGSTIARETDAGVYNLAGPEIGVASTKAFTSQLAILAMLTLYLGRQRGMNDAVAKKIARELRMIPKYIRKILSKKNTIKKIAEKFSPYGDLLYLGRKYSFPIALEGALKIKEISYVHAEGYAAGEMKHGPIALIDGNFPSVIVAPKDSVYEKTLSAIEEIKARKGKIVAIVTEGDTQVEELVDEVIYIPKTIEMLNPILSIIPLQLLAYYVGVFKGYDVDKPRNLAKSVTVE